MFIPTYPSSSSVHPSRKTEMSGRSRHSSLQLVALSRHRHRQAKRASGMTPAPCLLQPHGKPQARAAQLSPVHPRFISKIKVADRGWSERNTSVESSSFTSGRVRWRGPRREMGTEGTGERSRPSRYRQSPVAAVEGWASSEEGVTRSK